ncbi:RNase H domain-containing protein [Trichonephila clavipes]|nr:RNase H domain-containing protein [Trichonephila clavipes]
MCGISFINNIRDLDFSEICILTDKPSSIQRLSDCPPIGDSTSRSILYLFQQLSDRHSIHQQWVPSYVGLLGNEVVDDLAKVATSNPVDPEDHMVLTSTKNYFRAKELTRRTWPDGRGYELVSSVRALVPQKFSVEEELMHVKHVDVKSPHVGVMWKFGRGVISSGFVLVT